MEREAEITIRRGTERREKKGAALKVQEKNHWREKESTTRALRDPNLIGSSVVA